MAIELSIFLCKEAILAKRITINADRPKCKVSIFELIKDHMIIELIVVEGLLLVVFDVMLFDVLREDLVSYSYACVSDV